MKGNIKVGLVGCGRWGINILRDLLSLGCNVDVADPDPEARAMALKHGAGCTVNNIEAFTQDYDGYVVAAWTSQHGILIEQLLKNDKPIFSEKPLTNDPVSAEHIARIGKGKVFVMHKWLYHPGIETIIELAKSQRYGTIQQICTRRLQWTIPHRDVDGIWSLAPHDLSIIYGILGNMPAPRSATGILNSEGKAISLTGFLGNQQSPHAVIHIAVNWPVVERLVVVAFEQAMLVLENPLADHIKLYKGNGRQDLAKGSSCEEHISISTEYPLLRELRIFINHLAGGPPPKTDAAEGALVVRTIARLRSLANFPE